LFSSNDSTCSTRILSPQDRELLDWATERTQAFTKKVAAFEKGEWAAFLEAVEQVSLLGLKR